MEKLNEDNGLSTFNLTVNGYQGIFLKVQCEKAEDLLPITATHTKERIEFPAKASSHGQKFFVTGGTHVTADDFFCAAAVPVWDVEIKVMEVRKTECAWLEKVLEEGKLVLKLGKPISAL